MSTIVYEWFLEKVGGHLELRLSKRSDRYFVSEILNAPPSSAVIPETAISERRFATEEVALTFIEGQIAGRRSKEWILLEV